MSRKKPQTRLNRLLIDLNYENIGRSFSVYEFSSSHNFYEDNRDEFFDKLKQQLGALAVKYFSANRFFALFSKTENAEIELNKGLNKYLSSIDADHISFRCVEDIENFIEEEHSAERETYRSVLAQLLFNSLANQGDRYNNITGHLYYLVKRIGKPEGEDRSLNQWLAVEIHLRGGVLELPVRTFTGVAYRNRYDFEFEDESAYQSATRYIIEDYKMRRLLSSERHKTEAKDIFILRQLVRKGGGKYKNSLPFLVFSTYKGFRSSKMGILLQFLHDVQKHLRDYVKVNLDLIEFTQALSFAPWYTKQKMDKIAAFLKGRKINILDRVGTDESHQYVQDIIMLLKGGKLDAMTDIQVGKELDKDAINLCLIRNEKYYSKNKIKDAYTIEEGYLIHHLTLEGADKMDRHGMSNILKECCLKNDLDNKKISMYDWNLGKWRFVLHSEEKPKNGKKRSKRQIKNLYLMTVEQDGSFECKRLDLPDELWEPDPYAELKSEYHSYFINYNSSLEGLVIAPTGARNIIRLTDYFTIPDIESIGDRMQKLSEDITIRTDEFLNLLTVFISRYPQFIACSDIIRGALSLESPDTLLNRNVVFAQVKKAAKEVKSTFKEAFNDFLEAERGIVLMPRLRKIEKINQYLASSINIVYRNIDEKKAQYYVGQKVQGLRQKVKTATLIRQVEACGESALCFKELLPAMNVDFVRHGDLTVLPFPLKYLREYISREESKGIVEISE